MVDTDSLGDSRKLSEQVVKSALATLDWDTLKAHFEDIALSRGQLSEVCGHIRRYTELIRKYPRKDFECRRACFLDELRSYAEVQFGGEAASEIAGEARLIEHIEHGYRSILNVLAKCDIGKKPATVRVAATISRACYEYQDLIRRRGKTLSDMKQLNVLSGIRLQDDDGNTRQGQ